MKEFSLSVLPQPDDREIKCSVLLFSQSRVEYIGEPFESPEEVAVRPFIVLAETKWPSERFAHFRWGFGIARGADLLCDTDPSCSYLNNEFYYYDKESLHHTWHMRNDACKDTFFQLYFEKTYHHEGYWGSFLKSFAEARTPPFIFNRYHYNSEPFCFAYFKDIVKSEFIRGCIQNAATSSNSLRRKSKRRSISLKTRRFVFNRDDYSCVDCGRSPRTDKDCVLHVDHRVPVAKGGTNHESNLQTLCDWCNLGKGVDVDWKLGQAC